MLSHVLKHHAAPFTPSQGLAYGWHSDHSDETLHPGKLRLGILLFNSSFQLFSSDSWVFSARTVLNSCSSELEKYHLCPTTASEQIMLWGPSMKYDFLNQAVTKSHTLLKLLSKGDT